MPYPGPNKSYRPSIKLYSQTSTIYNITIKFGPRGMPRGYTPQPSTVIEVEGRGWEEKHINKLPEQKSCGYSDL